MAPQVIAGKPLGELLVERVLVSVVPAKSPPT
jgi:hypothetical protein